ncbi:actin-like protein 7A [Pezoporus wallicus]|uniref:actin-like protein 7A n=1 Tax=Pezoporus wallicus TaxID=35540 RepID=UPI00254A0A06|nr:actin-like protein 7A [Pezoporus wallicus]XP_061324630.1 actin-like protein 7A [Pezoporus flaviventris]
MVSHKSATTANLKAMKETKALVVDTGMGHFKCGFAGDLWPLSVVSPTFGKTTWEAGSNQRETFVGKELQNSSISSARTNPVRHGTVVDWNSVRDILKCIFKVEMKIQPEDHAVLMSVPPLCSTTDKGKYAEMLFEGLHMPAIHLAYQSHLSMYSYGKTSALVVESGHGVSHVVPIYEGYILHSITGKVDYAGSDITCYLMKLLNESGNAFTEHQLNTIQDLKEKCCYTSLDLKHDLSLPVEKQQVDYKLPDGHFITVGKERFLCAEALFKPELSGSQQQGLSQLTLACLSKCSADIISKMLGNVLLCGGSTMMEGFAERFQKELAMMFPCDSPIIATSPQRKFAVWIGGSILASLNSFQDLWVHRYEYEEHGSTCIFRKCF